MLAARDATAGRKVGGVPAGLDRARYFRSIKVSTRTASIPTIPELTLKLLSKTPKIADPVEEVELRPLPETWASFRLRALFYQAGPIFWLDAARQGKWSGHKLKLHMGVLPTVNPSKATAYLTIIQLPERRTSSKAFQH